MTGVFVALALTAVCLFPPLQLFTYVPRRLLVVPILCSPWSFSPPLLIDTELLFLRRELIALCLNNGD
jgi:hypothetical protein